MLPTGMTTLTETINPKILQLGFALEYSLVTNMYTGANRTGTGRARGTRRAAAYICKYD
jgi:hypothetical protein